MTTDSGSGEHRIVVGVDGSVSSKAALAWAVEQARLTGAVVEAVIAWEIPVTPRNPWPVALFTDFKSIAAETVADAIAEASGSAG